MKNVYKHQSLIKREDRCRQSGHKSTILWFTGLSGAGKSSLAHYLEKFLFDLGGRTYVLDGDNVRHGLCSDLGFTAQDREENVRRVGEVCKLFVDAGVLVLAAFISPYRVDRDNIRRLMEPNEFIEIYCHADIEVCEQRDVKGLYAKAKVGQIDDFTGVSAPYEPPIEPELTLETGVDSLHDCANEVLSYLKSKSIIGQ